MSSPNSTSAAPPDVDVINLRDPVVAAILAWLLPGLGHWYQGRRAKAVLFFVCILGTFLFGLYIGEGRVVYAAWRPEDRRLPYLCQVGAGAVALPALVQARRFNTNEARLAAHERMMTGQAGFFDWFMAPPYIIPDHGNDAPDALDVAHHRLKRRFELGTVYTMVAGLLNLLAMYDAWGGPALGLGSSRRRKESEADEAAKKPAQPQSADSPPPPAPAGPS